LVFRFSSKESIFFFYEKRKTQNEKRSFFLCVLGVFARNLFLMKDPRRQLGDAGEDLAAAALKKQGYQILERNYVTPLGEIDLIARHRGELVFIEVKTRRSDKFQDPRDAVTPAKQARLQRLADYYLQRKRLGEVDIRFDVVGIILSKDRPKIEIIQDAF
jgi:putative endonuclease